uniref:hypothetical protein n=1 Tax=Altererythrobacter segetis TaxID=1104773 RepID=UPI00140C1541|nr:hypothetical protein [Altererythrobacter segetis]
MERSKADRRGVLAAGTVIAAATGLASAAGAQANVTGGSWQPTAEPADAWLDKPGTRHRIVFDTTSMDTAGKGIHFANNFYAANESGYGLKSEALGVVVILRAEATPLGFGDSIWASYGGHFVKLMSLAGDKAARARKGNPLLMDEGEDAITLSTLRQKGATFTVCGMATHGIAGMVARATGKSPEAVEAEFKASLVPGALLVPAGIVAVNRAQEHGYALAYVS